nr:unnamed protein product [Homo sapiens]
MERQPGPVRGKLQIFQKTEKDPQARAGSPVQEYHTALVAGDLDHLKPLMDQFFQDANVVFEINKDEMEWQVKSPATFGLSGLWTLEYKRELTTPLCIAAAHGHTACVRHLLGRGADPDASPAGPRVPDRILRSPGLTAAHGAGAAQPRLSHRVARRLPQGAEDLCICPRSHRGAFQLLPSALLVRVLEGSDS